jgi:hypothetical protein
MKSTVLIIAISSLSRYTAASSEVSIPTSRFESDGGLKPERASDRAAGPIFADHPQVRASPVSVFFLNKSIESISFSANSHFFWFSDKSSFNSIHKPPAMPVRI